MKIDQRGLLAEEETSCKITEFFVDKVKSTTHFQHTNHMESSSIAIMDLHTTEPKTSKNGDREKLKQRKEPEYYSSSSNPKAKISLIGIRRQKNGRYAAEITDRITGKKVWLGTFDTIEEASQAYFSKKSEFEKLSQGRNKEDGSKKNCNPNETARIIRVQKRKDSGKYISEITNPISKKRIWLGTFGIAEEASQAYQSKKLEFQRLVDAKRQCGNEQTHSTQDENSGHENVNRELESASGSENVQRIDSHEIGTAEEGFHVNHSKKKQASYVSNSGLMANVYGEESSDECNTTTRCDPEVKRNLIGIRRRKSGRYDAGITDQIRHKRVCLGTFDTVEEASHVYFSKKSELEKLSELGNKENKPKKKSDQIQHESPVVETLNATSMVQRNKRSDSQRKEPRSSKGTSSDECNITTHCDPKAKISLIGIRRRKSGRYGAAITDRIRHKRVWLGTFDTVEEASQAYFSKKSELEKLSKQENKDNEPKENLDQIQQPESPVVETLNTVSMGRKNKRIESQGKEPGSSKATSCLMTNAHGAESSDECNTTTHCDPKAKISLIGIRRRKSGRYGAAITDPIKHKEVWLGTFDTAEEASQAYFAKKSEFEKLSQQGKREGKPKKIFDQIQKPESIPVAASLSVANDQTLDTSSLGCRRKKRNYSQKMTHMVRTCKRKMSGKYVSEIRNPISKLGTFDTAEEASRAHQSKKLEFQKLIKAKQQQFTNKQTHSNQDEKSENLVNSKHEHENITCELKSAGESAQLDVPLSNPSNGCTTVQSIDSFQIYKFDLPNSKKVELQSIMPTDSSVGEKQEAREDYEDLWMGEWVQIPGDDRAVMFSLKLGLPIIDNHGYLLGEFSSLDDLSIS